MSEPQHSTSPQSAQAPTPPTRRPRPAPRVGGPSLFAGVLLITAGLFNAVEGVVALFRDQVYVIGLQYVFAFDLTAWGWIHLIVGVVVAAAGVGVVTGQVWGRDVGIAVALLGMVVNFVFIPYYPVWSLLIIALGVFVVWALCRYDRDAAGD